MQCPIALCLFFSRSVIISYKMMLASKFASCGRIPITAFVTSFARQPVLKAPTNTSMLTRIQLYASETRSGIGRHAKRKSLKETMMEPAGDGRWLNI